MKLNPKQSSFLSFTCCALKRICFFFSFHRLAHFKLLAGTIPFSVSHAQIFLVFVENSCNVNVAGYTLLSK